MNLKKYFIAVSCLIGGMGLSAQTSIPFDTIHWDIRAQEYELTQYKGQDALLLNGGIAILNDGKLKNGIIEWDMAFPNQRGFTGIRFRMENLRNFEEFYFRPHQSGQPDANQYCPVDNGLSTWQLYHGDRYSVPYEYNFNKWFHVKLVLNDARAELFVDNMRLPILHIPFLKRTPADGQVMIYSSLVPVYFANFSYTSSNNPDLHNEPAVADEIDPLMVPTWMISNPFADTLLGASTVLDEHAFVTSWAPLSAESSGIANIGTISDFDRVDRNTVFARVDVNSDRGQIKAFHMGYSDKVKVFVNGRLIYSGDNTYRSRDFRYLGTIGFFDTFYLPLTKGRNEILVAVTESFGGWGICAKWGE